MLFVSYFRELHDLLHEILYAVSKYSIIKICCENMAFYLTVNPTIRCLEVGDRETLTAEDSMLQVAKHRPNSVRGLRPKIPTTDCVIGELELTKQ